MCSTKLEFAHQFQIFQTKKVTDIMETITAAGRIKQNKLRKIQLLAEQKTNWRKKKKENTKPTGKNQIVHEKLVQCKQLHLKRSTI